jgi:FixJ family two-component response regulator
MKKSTKRGQRKGRPYTPKPKQFRVLARHAAGHSDRRIAREEGISRGTVYRIRSQSENAMLLQSFREMILDIVPNAIKGLA